MTYTCLIVDDEQLARKLMTEYISKVPQLDLKGTCKNPLEALEHLNNDPVDILFLDIQMPDLTGIELIKSLPTKPVTVFTTAYSEYALEGYQLDVIDYLVKPFSFDRFVQAVNKATELVKLKKNAGVTDANNKTISLYSDHKIYKVPLDDIEYIEGLKEYVSYYTHDQRIIVLQSLKHIEEILPENEFMRVHKSYIVSVSKVKSLTGNQLQIGKKLIPIGRSYREEVIKKIFNQ